VLKNNDKYTAIRGQHNINRNLFFQYQL